MSNSDLSPTTGLTLRYGVITEHMVFRTESGKEIPYDYPFIAIVAGESEVPVMITSFHRFVPLGRKGNVVPLTSDNRSKLYYFTSMLNFVEVEHSDVFSAASVFDITKEMMNSFFQNYALRKNSRGEPVGEATIQGCIDACTATMYGSGPKSPKRFLSGSELRLDV